ncbi:immunoglobulin kappa light chain-like isoform X2 [Oryzias melastigma]|uniref:immunoglobulin kappa light chain-like isoform X2 n=1 Tax=Oryzias melastigma TaxID=30732 RepID=UPI000CF815F6|nr:immunoglobulin kappa light chain-like isoform X2 [Oryzias melastigma]
MTPLMFAGCVTCLLLGTVAYSWAQKSSASLHFKSVLVGDEVTLKCLYQGTLADFFFWYKQPLGQKPQLMSKFLNLEKNGSFVDPFKNDPRFKLETDTDRNHLKISNVEMSDSATYYCISSFSYTFTFLEGYSVHVKNSSSYIQTSVDQSSFENIHPGDSVTLNCTVHTGSCDGEHRVYWFKDSEDSHPGLIYTHRGRNDQCERKKNTQTHSCVYELPLKNITESHSGIYYCAVASCGHILFGNGTKLDLTGQPISWLVFFLAGSLTIMSVLAFFLVYKIKKQMCCQSKDGSSATSCTSHIKNKNKDSENLHYSAVNVKRSNRSRRQKNDLNTDCVYTTVRQQN